MGKPNRLHTTRRPSDSRYETVNRIRWLNGATVAWTSRYAIEGNVTYQHDTRSSVTNLLAVNVNAHLLLGRPKFQHGQGVAEGH